MHDDSRNPTYRAAEVGLDEDLLSGWTPLQPMAWRLWEPQRIAVILGRSSSAEREVHLARCLDDRVPIRRRLGGGCSVVLAPGMVVVSIASMRSVPATEELQRWTQVLASGLEQLGVERLHMAGTSDLCLGDRKVMGSCLYRGRDVSWYQASLLVDAEARLLERYLGTPVRMPEYRRQRPHEVFVTTLKQEGYELTCERIMAQWHAALRDAAEKLRPQIFSSRNSASSICRQAGGISQPVIQR